MSDSESENYSSTPGVEQKKRNNSRKPVADDSNKKRKQPSTSTSKSSRKKLTTVFDIFGVSKGESNTANDEDSQLASYFVNRVGVGCERRVTATEGAYYVDLKVYKSEDARSCESAELWKKALVRIKLQTDTDAPQWQALQKFVQSADTLFPNPPRFYDK